jgi:hypothetical protein
MKNNKKQGAKQFAKRLGIRIIAFVGFIAFLNFGIDSLQTRTFSFQNEAVRAEMPKDEEIPAQDPESQPSNDFCTLTAVECEGEDVKQGIFTSYNDEVGQCDSDPFTMASGKRVYEGAVANNCHPFGTKIKVNGKTYTVEDRMNKRYTEFCGTDQERFDIFKFNRKDNIGKQTLSYEIYVSQNSEEN